MSPMDLRGVPCPLNFVRTKLKLEQLATGDRLEVWLDAGEPIQQVPTSLKVAGHLVVELEPFIPGSVQQVARRIRQYLRTRPDYQQFSQDSPIGDGTARGHDVDEYSGSYVEFELDSFRVYVWFEYLLPLDGRPHHFSRPWIGSIDFQLCGEGYGEGLYSWLNISQSDIQLRKNASPSTLKAWTNWADALQKELARNFVPAGMAIAL